MLGAIIGDIVGSRFEWHNYKGKDFELLAPYCRPTDDSVMTAAVARAILDCNGTFDSLSVCAVKRMQELGRTYPHAGYGGAFRRWLASEDPQPYHSWGNGAGMRISPCSFAAATLEEAMSLSAAVTKVTHDDPEGLKGAEAVACCGFLARQGADKDELRKFIEDSYYPLDFTLDGIRESYGFDVSCMGSVPQAIEAFLESEGFEDAIRNAISIGGDSDTIAAMTGGIAETFYGIPDETRNAVLGYLPNDILAIVDAFEAKYPSCS